MEPACWPESPCKFVSGGVVHQSCMTTGVVHLSIILGAPGVPLAQPDPSRDGERFQR